MKYIVIFGVVINILCVYVVIEVVNKYNYYQYRRQLVEIVGEEGADFLENQAKSEFKGVTNENAKIHAETEGKLWRSDPEKMRALGGRAR